MSGLPFSIAMSVYTKDNAAYFDRALQSITEKQVVKPDEIVLVCDGPLNEELEDVIYKYEERFPIFHVIRLKENKGLGNALKIAVENASHELIGRMDSDDISLPDRFAQQVDFFRQNPGVDIVGGNITEFTGEEANIVGLREVPVTDSEIRKFMKKRAAFNHVSVMFKKTAVINAGNYQDWFWNEDYYLWIRMQLKGAVFANTGTVLVNVRVGEDMYRRRGGIKYFDSEFKIQKLMLKNHMIGYSTFIENVAKRFVIQCCLPNSLRGWVFKKYARSPVQKNVG